MAGCFDHMWYGRLYLHTHGAAVGQIGQQMGTFDDGLEEVDIAVTAYANGILLVHTTLMLLVIICIPTFLTLIHVLQAGQNTVPSSTASSGSVSSLWNFNIQ
jgi:hypothetical protein